MEYECTKCNKKFKRSPSQLKKVKNCFCSQSCSVAYNNKIRKRELKKNDCLNCNSKIPLKRNFCSRECEKIYKNSKRIESKNPGKRALKTALEIKCNKCSICGLENFWKDKPLIMVMDHIDGNPYNNELSNLRLVCPNCDSQLDTFKGKNKGKGRFERRQRYNNNQSY